MNRIFKTTAFLSAVGLIGLTGATNAQSSDTATDIPADCCSGGRMMAMLQAAEGENARDAQPTERVELDAEEQASIDALFSAYLSVQKSLVNDSAEGVVQQFEKVDKAAHSLDDAEDERLKSAIKKVSKAAHAEPETLDEAREAYKALSEAVIELANLAPPSDKTARTLYQAHCPMAEASWLQVSKELANPYMGQSMPKCGAIKQTLKERKQ